jgi:hypothetical protein
MSARQLRARLTRLERAIKPSDEKAETIMPPPDPAVVQAAWDWAKALQAEDEARIVEEAKLIKCPPSYGFKEYWEDEEKHSWPHSVFGDLPPEEIFQAEVRMEAFRQTPEGQVRLRIVALENGLVGDAQYEELMQLLKIYPEYWGNPKRTSAAQKSRLSPEFLKERARNEQGYVKRREERQKIEQQNKK